MALPAGMGLSAAAAAAGFAYQSPPPTPELSEIVPLIPRTSATEDPEDVLLGGLAALSEPVSPSTSAAEDSLGSSAAAAAIAAATAAAVAAAATSAASPAPSSSRVRARSHDSVGVEGAGGIGSDLAEMVQHQPQPPQQEQQQRPEQVQHQQQHQHQQQEQQHQRQEHQQQPPSPSVPPRIHQVTSPPPPHPPSSIKNVMSDLRSGKGAVLPGGGVGFQAVLCGKRGRRALRASEALTEEVRKRFPRQAGQAQRLAAVEEKLDKKINSVRRRLLYKLEQSEWPSKSLRTWLSLEVVSVPKGDGNTPAEDGAGADRDGQQSGESAGDDESKAELQAKGEEQREDKGARKAASTEGATKEKKGIEEKECFVLARLQGTIVDGPLDGVERRFTSFFSKVALQLDPKAFPEVAAVEWVRSAGCEDLHCVELRLPLEVALSRGLKNVAVKAFLHARVDDDRPRRFTLSAPLRRALHLAKRVETKPVLVSAVCEGLRRRGAFPSGGGGGGAGGGGGGGAGGTTICCDAELQNVLGVPAFRLSQLEEALGPHVEPAEPPMLDTTVPLKEGSTAEKELDVCVNTETPFQLQAVRLLLGSDGSDGGSSAANGAPGRVGGEADGVPEVAAEAGGKDNKRVEREGQQIRPLGVHTVAEREAQMRLDRQIAYLLEKVNASGRRAAMLRALSEDPMRAVPRLETQLQQDEELLAAAAGMERPAREGEVEPWRDESVCDQVVKTRADDRRKEQVKQAMEEDRRARAEQNARAVAVLQNAKAQQRQKLRQKQEEARAAAMVAEKQAAERGMVQLQQLQQRVRDRQAQERALMEERDMKRRQQLQLQQQQQQQQQQQAVLLAQRQAAQADRARTLEEATRQAREQREQRMGEASAIAAVAKGMSGNVGGLAGIGGGGDDDGEAPQGLAAMQSEALLRMRMLQQQQQQKRRQQGQEQQGHVSGLRRQPSPLQGLHMPPLSPALAGIYSTGAADDAEAAGGGVDDLVSRAPSPRGRLSPTISPRDGLTGGFLVGPGHQQQQSQRRLAQQQGLAPPALQQRGYPGQSQHTQQQRQQQQLPPLAGGALHPRFLAQQQQQQQERQEGRGGLAGLAVETTPEDRDRQLEQTLLSQNDEAEPPPAQQQPQQHDFQWPGAGRAPSFPSAAGGAAVEGYQQASMPFQGQGQPPRDGTPLSSTQGVGGGATLPSTTAGVATRDGGRKQHTDESWRRRRQQQMQQQQQQQQQRQVQQMGHSGGIGMQSKPPGLQSQIHTGQSTRQPFSPAAAAAPASPAVAGGAAGGVAVGVVPGGGPAGHTGTPQPAASATQNQQDDTRRFRQRQYKQLAQLTQMQQGQQQQQQQQPQQRHQRQRSTSGLPPGATATTPASGAMGGYRAPAPHGAEGGSMHAEWARHGQAKLQRPGQGLGHGQGHPDPMSAPSGANPAPSQQQVRSLVGGFDQHGSGGDGREGRGQPATAATGVPTGAGAVAGSGGGAAGAGGVQGAVGLTVEQAVSDGGLESELEQHQQQQQQVKAPSYTGWQSQTERRRSETDQRG